MTITHHQHVENGKLYISVHRAADETGYRPASIYSLAQLGLIETTKIGSNVYFEWNSLMHWYNGHRGEQRAVARKQFAAGGRR